MARTRLAAFCDRVIEAGWLAGVVVVPLFFNVYSSRVFEPDKISTLRSIALIMVAAWAIKWIENSWPVEQEDGDVERPSLWRRLVETPLALPTLALVVVYLISTAFSIVPRVSLLGSYQRLQGTFSMFSYIVLFAMMAQGMRSKEQVERFVTTVVIVSLPIALYGILQHYGRDPLPWGGDVRSRVAGHMGNAIFIAAYLIMAVPVTLYRVVESFSTILNAEESRFVDILLGASYIFILAVQFICIFFTQSRGPWLGLIGGLFFFFLVLAVVRRWRWMVWGTVAVMLAVAAFLIVFNMPNSPLAPLRKVPYLGRLGRVFETERSTGKVRVLIWQGAIELILPHPPLEKPDGSKDRMNWARPLIGYGPESMYVAYNRFYPPDLAHYEKRNASPDRSHNETFDALVITGLIGFLVYMWLFMTVVYLGFRWLGVIADARQRNLFIGLWIVGGMVGAVLMGVWQGRELVGVGLPAGIAAGLGLYLVLWGLFLSRRGERVLIQEENPYALLVVALVAAIIAHFVEIHFGIAIGATRTYFWTYVGLMLVVGYLLPRRQRVAREVERQRAAAATSKRKRRRRRKLPTPSPSATTAAPSGFKVVIPYALVLALVLCTLAYDFVSNQGRLESPQQVLWASLSKLPRKGQMETSYGILSLVAITWLLGGAIVIAEWRRRGGRGEWGGPLGACLSISLFIAFLFAMILAGRLVSATRQRQLLDMVRLILGMFSSYYVLVFTLLALIAFSLMEKRELALPWLRPGWWWAYPVLLAVALLIVVGVNVQIIHADIVYKQAEPWERQKQWDFSIVLHQEAIKRAPHEDFYYLFLGRAFLEKAKRTPVGDQPPRHFTIAEVLRLSPAQLQQLKRDDLMRCSETVLLEAQRLNPLNTDHSANLGRLYRTWAELTGDKEKKQEYFARSLEYYRQATSLSPHAAHLFDEWGLVYFVMGKYQEAIAKYEYSLTIDDQYVNTYLSLGDAYMAINELDKAKGVYLKAAELSPRIPQVHSVLAYLYGKEGKYGQAISETLRVLELTKDKRLVYNSYKNLALYYQQVGDLKAAMKAAQEALARAPESERAGLQSLIAQLAQGGATPESEVLVQQFLTEGETALNNRQWKQAEEAYRKAIGLNPNLAVAHSALAYIYAQQGRLEEAEKENLTVLKLIPGDYATLKNLAIIYRQMKRYDESISYARQAIASPQASEEEKKQLEAFIREVEQEKKK